MYRNFKLIILAFVLLLILPISVFARTQVRESANTQARNKIPISRSVSIGTMQQTTTEKKFLVSRVIDGDTIELSNGKKVRYIAMDTPETVDPRKPIQCFGVEASNRNKQLVEGKTVLLEKDISETDRYGRLLRYVYIDGVFVNLFLVQEGFAYSYTYPPDVKYQSQFTEAERLAREQKRGLWGSCPIYVSTPVLIPVPLPASSLNTNCTIKGNISSSGEKIYHIRGCGSYNVTKIDEARGERWFCTEKEAVTTGWRKAKNCPK